MYFEIENTPEHIRRARCPEPLVKKESPKEQCPRLELAPFSRPPKVVFENVIIGTTSEKCLEIFNPSKKVQQISLNRDLPPGLEICIPGEILELEPQTCYCVRLLWTPTQPTALRETIRFIDETRGRYDVIVVLKSIVNEKIKNPKKTRKSPGKITKKSINRKSPPVLVAKKKENIIISQNKLNKYDLAYTTGMKYKSSEKYANENKLRYNYDCSFDYQPEDSLFSTMNNSFKMSEVFPNSRNKKKDDIFRLTYDKVEGLPLQDNIYPISNILKSSNKQSLENTACDMFDNLTLTPLKTTAPARVNKLEKGPRIIINVESPEDIKENLEIIKINNEMDGTHSVICVTPFQENRIITSGDSKVSLKYDEGFPAVQTSKIPNTSSPKELFSPNFTINTDISFIPQRVSTEKKMHKISSAHYNEMIDEPGLNDKLNSETYTKSYSPNNPHLLTEQNLHKHMELSLDAGVHNVKHCRQSLFKESYPGMLNEFRFRNPSATTNIHNIWANRSSPPRPITPPLQCIPEESNFSDTYNLPKTEPQMTTFTLNRTFNKTIDKSASNIQTWSKKAIRCEPELWKIPVSCPRKAKKLEETKSHKGRNSFRHTDTLRLSEIDKRNSFRHTDTLRLSEIDKINSFRHTDSLRLSEIGNTSSILNVSSNVYSQSFTVDPFSSATYFYDEKMVDQFENEFKKWLNYILTPPSDLDSNIDFKIDVGKAWLENRNKEIPAAPTKEKVCSIYHNNNRLESLRKSARILLKSPELKRVLQKLYLQIDKKLITIRNDRNLHLDVGLQKIIMEILLCYNPLWLRIALEAIYNIIIPLKSNSDIEGLTTFIVQNMFRNSKIKNKQSHSSMPNMLTPLYLEALKKFTMKKFFTLVFFLDQAKQKKLIPHDPCLFCRNAIWKESREILINFTKELIAGIGDITRHLRPMGYVVTHKQSFIDEYKYAVHNIAIDIRDGIRLTRVMEIILLKNNLMCQLRTPPISRLQKIHNVQVALTALKDAGFTIVGDITAIDIADGHREKTLSLLWQIIHVFRAPLFEKAALVIQTWWRKKYEVIVAEKRKRQLIELKRHYAATVIQRRWRKILYDRMMQIEMQRMSNAALVIQKYWRMWVVRKYFYEQKCAISIIQMWYERIKKIREAKRILQNLREQNEKLKNKSAVKIQTAFRRWMCMKAYQNTKARIIYIQNCVRRYLQRSKYLKLKKAVVCIQQQYKGKLTMRKEMQKLATARKSAIVIQSYFRMFLQRKRFLKLKEAVHITEVKYAAKVQMRIQRYEYLQLRKVVIFCQSSYRVKIARQEYERKRQCIMVLQRKIRATIEMKRCRNKFLRMKNAANVLQKYIKAYIQMKNTRMTYLTLRESVIKIQIYYKSYTVMKVQRTKYLKVKKAAITLQRWYKSLLQMKAQRDSYLKLKMAVSIIQSRYRALSVMRQMRSEYLNTRKAAILIQRQYRAQLAMRKERNKFIKLKMAAMIIQRNLKAFILGKRQRQEFLIKKNAILKIQKWYRGVKQSQQVQQQYKKMKQSAVAIQRVYKTYVIRKEYIRIRKAVITIQKYFRTYKEMKITRTTYLQKKNSCIIIQRMFRSYVLAKMEREMYLKKKNAVITIQRFYRQYKQKKIIHQAYRELKKSVITIQRRYRNLQIVKKDRSNYKQLKKVTIMLQQRYRSLLIMRHQRKEFKTMQSAAIIIQRQYTARLLMKVERIQYLKLKSACLVIQRTYRAYLIGKTERNQYLQQKHCAVIIQLWYRRWKQTERLRSYFLKLKTSAMVIQKWYRAILYNRKMKMNRAATTIQRWYKSALIRIQCRRKFLQIRKSIIVVQSLYRMRINRKRFIKMQRAAKLIQSFYYSYMLMKEERRKYLNYRNMIIKLQSLTRCYLQRKQYITIRTAAMVLQRAYRLKKRRELLRLQEQQRRTAAAICIQKYFRRHLALSQYQRSRRNVIYLQRMWKNILLGRLFRCSYLQKKKLVIQLQAHIRGYLTRKQVEHKKEEMIKLREEQRINRAASKIQAAFRGHLVRVKIAHYKRVVELRRRWREGALQSKQETLRERNEEALDILKNMYDIEKVIRAFKTLELTTEVYPMTFDNIADGVVSKIYIYMLTTNRSISSVEILVLAAQILVNLTRYSRTVSQVYERERIGVVLKFMLRFSNSETSNLFCILCTFLWLFAKYDGIREDLTDFLHVSDNWKMLASIKTKIERMKRMTRNTVKNKPIRHSSRSNLSQTLDQSLKVGNLNSSFHLPTLEPDYGIYRPNKPRYFEDALQAINCLFKTYNL